jgi:O-antigen/teichoic acid export membrane protein
MFSIFRRLPAITQNTTVKLFSEIIGRIAYFALVIFAARRLGETDFGLFSYGLALGFVLAQLGDMGLQTVLTREVATHGKAARPFVIRALHLKALLSLLVLSLLWLVISRQPAASRGALYLLGIMLLTQTYLEFAAYIFRGQQQIAKEAWLLATARITTAVTGGILLWQGGGVLGLALTGWMAVALLTAVSFWQLQHAGWLTGWQRIAGNKTAYRALMQQAFPLGIAVFMSIAYTRLAVLMLQQMMGETAVAQYSAAMRLVEPTQILPASLLAAVFPVISLAWYKDRPHAVQLGWRVSGLLAFFGTAIAIVYLLVAKWLIPFLYGEAYTTAVSVFQILALSIIPAYINYSLTHYLIVRRQQAYIGWFNGLVLTGHALLCWLLIPRLGVIGPALSVVIAELFLMVACLFVLRFRTDEKAIVHV